MIVVNLAGGLGNQMFQYAMGFSLEKQTGIPIHYSTTFSQYTFAPKTIDKVFNLDLNWCNKRDLKSTVGIFRSTAFARRLLGKIATLTQMQINAYFIADLCSGYQHIVLNEPDKNYYFHGYWQSELYFKSHYHILREKFAFRGNRRLNELSANLQEKDTKIGIHIRRGDYITNRKAATQSGVQSNQYYIKGVQQLRGKFKNSKIFVFSDEIEWAKNLLAPIFNDIYFGDLENSNASSDMQMLSQCDHFVLSNSTFGWWAAYLSSGSEKIVITPEKWFADGSNCNDIVPKRWLESQNKLEN